MQVERLTETEERILRALATYRFLTPQQMRMCGVSQSRRHLYTILSTLSRRSPKLIAELDFGVLPGKGRLPRVYYLTKAGADLLDFEGREVPRTPSRVRLFNSDYFHRVNCVDFHIALRNWATASGASVDFFHSYFDPAPERTSRGGLHPRTRIKLADRVLVPDAVFSFTTPNSLPRLCAFELYNGRRTARVESQLSAYLAALDSEAIEETYRYPHAVRILAVFDDPAGERLAHARISQRPDFATYAPSFFLKTLEAVSTDFVHAWHQPGTSELLPLFT